MSIFSSDKTRYKMNQVFWIALAWTLVGTLDALFIHFLLTDNIFISPTELYRFIPNLVVNSVSGFIGGFAAGYILVFYVRDAFRDRSYGWYLLLNSAVICLLIFLFSFITNDLFQSYRLGLNPFHPEVLSATKERMFNLIFVRTVILWFIVLNGTLLALNINDKYGPGIFMKFLLGRYHHPREEERIFMFLDMNHSTTIAEEIGHIKYYTLLNSVFADITDAILSHAGEIYQYVGDEVVISWTRKNGLRNANCINCYFGILEALASKAGKYTKQFGLVPEFKAGLHYGDVTTGEVGIIKKDLVFTGDVLNTTARIRTKCTEFGVNLLVSDKLLNSLRLPPHSFVSRKIGTFELKGKSELVTVHTIEGAMRF
ncbi:MAG: adenylate/guanylate cyclase domain-containing protein [Bacteroidota bacterium]